ncbi:MAG: glycosyltransferase [Sphingobacteriaceae bacterium]
MVLVYMVFFFLVIRFCVTLFNFISRPLLPKSTQTLQVLVSVLIPARNEERNIATLLTSLEQQDYQHIEILVLDDSSTDATAAICSSFVSRNARFKLVKGQPLAEGWLGKNYACHQLAKEARGQYFIFLDADTWVQPGFIAAVVQRLKTKRLDLLSIFPTQEMRTLGEQLFVGLINYVLLTLLPVRLVKLSKNPLFSAANGQCMAFDAETYRQKNWHEQVKANVVDDIEIMRALKVWGGDGEILLDSGFISCRMYRGFSEALQGFSKNVLVGFGNSILVISTYLFLLVVAPFILVFFVDIRLCLFALSLILLSRVMIALLSRQSLWKSMLLHPLQLLGFVILAVVAVQKKLSHSSTWKGRNVA